MWANYNFFMPSFIVNYVWVGNICVPFWKYFCFFCFCFFVICSSDLAKILTYLFPRVFFFQFRNQKWSKRKTLLYISFYEKGKPIYSLRLVEKPLSIVKRNPSLSYDVIREAFLSFYQDIRPQKSFLITSRRQGILQTFLVTTDMRSSLFSR